jgi:hypothetical protein
MDSTTLQFGALYKKQKGLKLIKPFIFLVTASGFKPETF